VPAEHGGPLRLVVPGWDGIWWVKWPVEVRLSAEPAEAFDGFWQNQRYTYQDDEGRVLSAVRDQLPRAVLSWPYDGAVVSGDASVEILAWAGEHAVTAVELSADDGATWVPGHHVGTGAMALDPMERPPALGSAPRPAPDRGPGRRRRRAHAGVRTGAEPARVRQQPDPRRPAGPGRSGTLSPGPAGIDWPRGGRRLRGCRHGRRASRRS
jgi:DMSO/TMAO reductase YedYZ molybdopterin-dependent catalytic subunit